MKKSLNFKRIQQIANLLNENAYYKYEPNESDIIKDSFIIHRAGPIINPVYDAEIIEFLLSKGEIKEAKFVETWPYGSYAELCNLLPVFEGRLLENENDTVYLPFSDEVLKIQKDMVESIKYSELDTYVFKKSIIVGKSPKDASIRSYYPCYFDFIKRATNILNDQNGDYTTFNTLISFMGGIFADKNHNIFSLFIDKSDRESRILNLIIQGLGKMLPMKVIDCICTIDYKEIGRLIDPETKILVLFDYHELNDHTLSFIVDIARKGLKILSISDIPFVGQDCSECFLGISPKNKNEFVPDIESMEKESIYKLWFQAIRVYQNWGYIDENGNLFDIKETRKFIEQTTPRFYKSMKYYANSCEVGSINSLAIENDVSNDVIKNWINIYAQSHKLDLIEFPQLECELFSFKKRKEMQREMNPLF